MDGDTTYKVIVTESGEQIPIKEPAGVKVFMALPHDPVKKEITLDVTAEEFANIQTLAVTNDIPAGILSANGADTSR